MATIKERLCESLLVGDPDKRIRVGKEFASKLRPDGSWADINYRDQDRAYWRTLGHLGRVLHLARACRTADLSRTESGDLKPKTLNALDHWLKKDYRNSNWWFARIGVPRYIVRILALMEKDLSPAQKKAGLDIAGRATLGMTGQNRVWVSELAVWRGALAGDAELVNRGIAEITDTIRITTREGIQPDFSFHQHGRQLYSGGYGAGFGRDCARFAALLRGTRFAFKKEKVDILTRYILDGQQWMLRGKTFDYGAVGRELARPNKSGRFMLGTCEDMAKLGTARKKEFVACAERVRNGGPVGENVLRGNRFFWRSDIMTHHRKAWFASVRMASKGLIETEVCNNENLKGRYLAAGVNYVMRHGGEYHNIFPAWDWNRLPGTTLPKEGGVTASRFVGGVSDGLYGAAVFDLAQKQMKARKAWFFFDREFVCLGAGITHAKGKKPVALHTTVNQCHLKGSVTWSNGGAATELERGTRQLKAARWVHHDGVGYVFPEGADVQQRNDAHTGSWKAINAALSADKVSLDVFMLWLNHGPNPTGVEYHYVVVPGIAAKELEPYAKKHPTRVLSNTPSLQAVRNESLKLTQAVFYQPGRIEMKGKGLSISVDKPCAILVREMRDGMRLAVSCPAQRLQVVAVEVDRKLTGDGCKWVAEKGISRIRVELPRGDLAGKSVVRELKPQR